MNYTAKMARVQLNKAQEAINAGRFDVALTSALEAYRYLKALADKKPIEPSDYETVTPDGYETAMAYVFTEFPLMKSQVEDVTCFIYEDEPELADLAASTGCAVACVTAPKVLIELGIQTTLAFPSHVLRRYYRRETAESVAA